MSGSRGSGVGVGGLTGKLLAATPSLDDPNFERTVILLLEHNEEGALGVVINRPSDVPVAEVLPEWAHLAAAPGVLFAGGPVQQDGVLGLAEASATASGAFHHLLPGVASLDLEAEGDLAGIEAGRARFFAGYSGWARGQLEGEIAVGAWFTVDAEPGDLFLEDMDELWEQVIRRQGDVFLTFPSDATLN